MGKPAISTAEEICQINRRSREYQALGIQRGAAVSLYLQNRGLRKTKLPDPSLLLTRDDNLFCNWCNDAKRQHITQCYKHYVAAATSSEICIRTPDSAGRTFNYDYSSFFQVSWEEQRILYTSMFLPLIQQKQIGTFCQSWFAERQKTHPGYLDEIWMCVRGCW